MSPNDKIKSDLINDILITCKANNVPTTGELFFSLISCTVSELKTIKLKM